MRIEGKLHYLNELGNLTEAGVEQVMQSILTQAQMESYKTTNELDFSFTYIGSKGEEIRFRGNACIALNKMSIAFRLIPLEILSIDELGLPPVLKEISKYRRGLFLVTGPTGHGKSTTLSAIINEINNTREDHIMTIEDPVEFIHTPKKCLINQREVGSDTDSLAAALRRALRHDPDVLLIGELRDLETIGIAITAAETGHLVFGTLHTQDAAQSVNRLIDVFPPTQQPQVKIQLSTVLVGVCAQQLIPRGLAAGGGRVCATELLLVNPAVRNCIREGKTNQLKTVIQTGLNSGMHTMEQCLAELVLRKILPVDAALSFAYDPKDLQRLLDQAKREMSGTHYDHFADYVTITPKMN
jgi:twitching motility protein PilT